MKVLQNRIGGGALGRFVLIGDPRLQTRGELVQRHPRMKETCIEHGLVDGEKPSVGWPAGGVCGRERRSG